MYILGISCFYHDAAAALLQDGKLIAAAEEERFSRIKHDINFPEKAIKFCLDHAAISPADVDYVVFYEKTFQKFERILMTGLHTYPKSWRSFGESMLKWLPDRLWLKNIIREKLGIAGKRIFFSTHHLSHAASCYYPSPFREAAILTVDGVGEWTSATVGVGRENEIRLIKEMHFPHSLGLLYSAFTAFLGFKVNEGEYKVMGMAPYGEPKYVDEIYDNLIKVANDGSFWLNMDYFSYHYSDERTYNCKFERLFGEPRRPESPFFTADTGFPSYFGDKPSNFETLCRMNKNYADIAASIQEVTEETLLKLVENLHSMTGVERLCIAGGVGLNAAANGRILRESPFDEIFIQPAAGDAGGALGAALYLYHQILGEPRKFVLEHVYYGREYSENAIRSLLEDRNIAYEYFPEEGKLVDRVVDDLLHKKVVGWFQGRFEWGPRALGNRSILADPRDEDMKDLLNLKIKFREPFRPFAPVICEEGVDDFFQFDNVVEQYPARYMLLVLPLKPAEAEKVGAVNHLGTARLQTLREEWNPRYYKLVQRFGEATGVPVLLNTSFNLRGEPIVESPFNALDTFARSGIDVLVLDRYLITK